MGPGCPSEDDCEAHSLSNDRAAALSLWVLQPCPFGFCSLMDAAAACAAALAHALRSPAACADTLAHVLRGPAGAAAAVGNNAGAPDGDGGRAHASTCTCSRGAGCVPRPPGKQWLPLRARLGARAARRAGGRVRLGGDQLCGWHIAGAPAWHMVGAAAQQRRHDAPHPCTAGVTLAPAHTFMHGRCVMVQ
eukprot:365847-Chlamydomonas_euryale.AAC.41